MHRVRHVREQVGAAGRADSARATRAAVALFRVLPALHGTLRQRVLATPLSGRGARSCGPVVPGYLRFRLSDADVVELLAERGITVARSTVYRWGQRLLPSLHVAARRHRQPVGVKWRVEETYCRLGGKWASCYRAIDQHGQVVDVLFSERRNAVAARTFFERAIGRTRVRTCVAPARVTTDRAAVYPPALRQLLPAAEHRCSKYLNNGIERHRARPAAPHAAAAPDARLQVPARRRHGHPRSRPHAEPTKRLLVPHRKGAASAPPRHLLARVAPRHLSHDLDFWPPVRRQATNAHATATASCASPLWRNRTLAVGSNS